MASALKLAGIGLVLLAAGPAQAGPAAPSNLYCCQDPGGGRRVCGDSLPEQCRGRAYKIFDSGGNLAKEVGPPLTPEQKAQAAAEAKRKKEQEAVEREQMRRDQALLDTYSSVQDIDLARARSEADWQQAIKSTEAKIADLRQQRKKYENEAEFYRNKPLPPDVAKGLKNIDSEIKSYTDLLDGKKADFAQVRAKYDEDKRRYLQISGGSARPR